MASLTAVEPLKAEQLRLITVQQLMTPEQLAGYLQVEVATLYVWVSRGRIPRRKVGHLLRFDLEEIQSWTKGNEADRLDVLIKHLASTIVDEDELGELTRRLTVEARRKLKSKKTSELRSA